MNQQQKKKDGLRIGPIIVIVIALLNAFGRVGVLVLAPILIIGAAVWMTTRKTRNAKAEENSWTQSNEMKRDEIRESRQGAQQSFPDRMASSKWAHLESLDGEGHDGDRQRAEELKDLLAAGIIDRAEYNDRMALLSSERHY